MTAALWMFLLSLGAESRPPAEPIGVLRYATGLVHLRSDHAQLIYPSAELTTKEGWAELLLGAHVRLRTSGFSQVRLNASDRTEVIQGRVWCVFGAAQAPFFIQLGNQQVLVSPQSELVIEASEGGLVSVLRGSVQVAKVKALKGEVLFVAQHKVRSSGLEVFELVRREASIALKNPSGWRQFVLRQVEKTQEPEVTEWAKGHAARLSPFEDPVEATVEEARRTSPFD